LMSSGAADSGPEIRKSRIFLAIFWWSMG
jgi:hypothetical protein